MHISTYVAIDGTPQKKSTIFSIYLPLVAYKILVMGVVGTDKAGVENSLRRSGLQKGGEREREKEISKSAKKSTVKV